MPPQSHDEARPPLRYTPGRIYGDWMCVDFEIRAEWRQTIYLWRHVDKATEVWYPLHPDPQTVSTAAPAELRPRRAR